MTRRVVFVNRSRLSVECYRLVQERIVGLALHLKGDVVPGIIYRIAWNAGRDPMRVDVVPDVPRVFAEIVALVPEYQSQAIEVHADVEFKNLHQAEIRGIEVGVVGKIVQGWNQLVIIVRQALRRIRADQRIAEQNICVRMCAAQIELGCVSAKRWRSDTLLHPPGDAGTRI